MTPERIAELRKRIKCQMTRGRGLTQPDMEDFLALLSDHEAALPLLEAAKKALSGLIKFKPFWLKFDHCGARNSTQLDEHELFLAHMKRANEALAAIEALAYKERSQPNERD